MLWEYDFMRALAPKAKLQHEALFHVGDWYRAEGIAVPTPAFLETVPYRFGIADLAQHYHLPLKMTPWGFSLCRGGA